MIGPGLSPEQGPTFSVPLRFFLTAPIFLAAAGLGMALLPQWAASPHSPQALALTHLLTLGFLGMVMLGAMSQMLPVIAGAPLPQIKVVAWVSHLGLLTGTPLLALGLAGGGLLPLESGAGLLGLALITYLASAGQALVRAKTSDTTQAMRLAVAALAATLLLGLALAAWLGGHWLPAAPLDQLTGHALWGLAGWILVLVMGSAWQVVPMLQLTPPYPAALTRWAWRSLLIALPLASLAPPPWRGMGHLVIACVAIAFAGITLKLQGQRKRKLTDTTLDFWRIGMACLIAAALPFAALGWVDLPDAALLLAALLFLLGFATSVVSGMLYKIVPFLAWFHLQAHLGFKPGLPNMRDYLPGARARQHYRLHLAALILLLPAPYLPWLAVPGGLLLAAAAVSLHLNLARAYLLYRSTYAAGCR